MRATLALLVLCLPLSTGCVAKKKYDALAAELDAARGEIAGLGQQVGERDGRITELSQALADEQGRLAALQGEHAALQQRYDDETSALRQEKAELLKDRTRLRASVDEVKSALDEVAARKAAAEARVAQYKDMLGRFQALIDAGRLRVEIIDGRMVVVLATDILFESGKADLSEAGAAALTEVGAVLAAIPERAYQVEGHTDDVPIKTQRFPSNWELGSARAVTVVQKLVEAGVAPERLSAASYSQYRPAAANDSTEGKASNRRIEIVVVPDLSLLPGAEELSALER